MLKNFFALVCLALFIGACNEDSNIGEDLLSDQKLDLSYKNNFSINANTVLSEDAISYTFTKSVLNAVNSLSPSSSIIGEINDPKFGKIKASFYSRVIFNPNFPIPVFKDLSLDSAVLTLAYDTVGFYGDKTAAHNFLIEEITEDYDKEDSIYISKKLTTGRVIGQKTFVPNVKDSIQIINHADSTKQKLSPRIRVRLDDQWANEVYKNALLVDGATGTSEEVNNTLYKVFKGMKISSTSDGKSFLGLNVSDASINSGGQTRLTFYFKEIDNDEVEYSFYMSSQKFNSFEIDNTSSTIADFINSPEKSDSLLFLQSMSGPSFYIETKDLSVLKNKNISHASVDFTIANLADDNLKLFPPVTQIIASYKNKDGKLTIIDDVANLISIGAPLSSGFGGGLTGKINEKQTYSINVTNHLKSLIEDESIDRKIYISANNRSIRPNISIIYGPKHSKFPIKLKIVFAD
jgi:hypothetical protein